MDEEGSYKEDQKDGLWTEYYADPGQNGAKKKVSNYSNGLNKVRKLLFIRTEVRFKAKVLTRMI